MGNGILNKKTSLNEEFRNGILSKKEELNEEYRNLSFLK